MDWKKSVWKGVRIAIYIAVLGGIGYVSEVPELVYLLPILEAIRNAWKHRKD